MDSMSGYEEIWELISQVRNVRCARLFMYFAWALRSNYCQTALVTHLRKLRSSSAEPHTGRASLLGQLTC